MFIDRILVTLVHLRPGLPHAALAQMYGVDRSTVSGAIRCHRKRPGEAMRHPRPTGPLGHHQASDSNSLVTSSCCAATMA
ncbi:transposase family protein [Streptomyces sp. SCSIO 30461]|uniref:transposase family protein n=1 Tax=Streptomyces sp. SCSIO 30461 TaxID=3118085 RepID=UPI00387E476B